MLNNILSIAFLCGSALCSLGSILKAQDAPAPGEISIGNVSALGNGCPSGSVAVNISSDNKAMTVIFDRFVVDASDSPTGISRRSCDVSVGLTTPPGWTYTLFAIEFRGFASLEAGAHGRQTAVYQADSNPPFTLNDMILSGPFVDDYQHLNVLPIGAAPYSPCGSSLQVLRIRTDVEASGRRQVAGSRVVNCSSGQGRRADCEVGVPITSINVENQISAARCVQGRNFGINGSQIWVKNGCRADFRVGTMVTTTENAPQALMTVDSIDGELQQQYGMAWRRCNPAPEPVMIECASGRGRPSECAIGRRIARAELIQKISASPCIEGRTWGVNGDRLWVKNGCRAHFKVFPAP